MSEAHRKAQRDRRAREAVAKETGQPVLRDEYAIVGNRVRRGQVLKGDAVAIRNGRAIAACIGIPTELLEPGSILKLAKYANQLAIEVNQLRGRLAICEERDE